MTKRTLGARTRVLSDGDHAPSWGGRAASPPVLACPSAPLRKRPAVTEQLPAEFVQVDVVVSQATLRVDQVEASHPPLPSPTPAMKQFPAGANQRMADEIGGYAFIRGHGAGIQGNGPNLPMGDQFCRRVCAAPDVAIQGKATPSGVRTGARLSVAADQGRRRRQGDHDQPAEGDDDQVERRGAIMTRSWHLIVIGNLTDMPAEASHGRRLAEDHRRQELPYAGWAAPRRPETWPWGGGWGSAANAGEQMPCPKPRT